MAPDSNILRCQNIDRRHCAPQDSKAYQKGCYRFSFRTVDHMTNCHENRRRQHCGKKQMKEKPDTDYQKEKHKISRAWLLIIPESLLNKPGGKRHQGRIDLHQSKTIESQAGENGQAEEKAPGVVIGRYLCGNQSPRYKKCHPGKKGNYLKSPGGGKLRLNTQPFQRQVKKIGDNCSAIFVPAEYWNRLLTQIRNPDIGVTVEMRLEAKNNEKKGQSPQEPPADLCVLLSPE